MKGSGNRFFQVPHTAPTARTYRELIEELIEQITFLKSAFEDEFERTTSIDDKKHLQAAIERSAIRLDTLHRMKENSPVLPEHLDLLLEYGNNRKQPEIVNYPNILAKERARNNFRN
jgi:hypothetical protein